MEVVECLGKIAIVQLSPIEVTVLKNALDEVRNALSIWDLKTRTGFSSEEFSMLLNLITQSNKEMDFRFSIDELRLLNNALNEVCNGIALSNFEERISVPRDRARILLNSIHSLIDRISREQQ